MPRGPADALLERIAVPAMIAMGGLVAVQSEVTGELAHQLGTGLRAGAAAAVVSFVTGLVILSTMALAVPGVRRGFIALRPAVHEGRLRPWQLAGGAAGALLVASQALSVGTIGVALFTVAVVAGQTSSAILVDRFGLGPSGVQVVTAGRVLGALLTVGAVGLSVLGRLSGPGSLAGAGFALALLPLAAGMGSSWQQAVNGRVSAVAGPFGAALNNFVVGTVLLVMLLAVSLLLPGRLTRPPTTWYLYLGGVIGVLFIVSAAALVKVHGVLVLGLCIVAGQVTMSVLIDALGDDSHLGLETGLGAVLTLVGVGIVAVASRRARGRRLRPALQDA